ncbi:MAG: tail fiber domain-containing protein [Verrucomicrobia bacterium]|nr:tail fiber domain-containing protein [Verrucomicrobiota bacterium]
MKSMKSMKSKMQSLFVLAAVVIVPQLAQAQATSRVIPFNNLVTNYPRRTTQSVIVQLWDAPTAGNLVFSESQPNVSADDDGNLSLVFGSQTPNGLDPTIFPSGASRYLDVIDGATQLSVLTNGRIALNATAFALTPGPEGPQGPAGPQGPPGLVQTVTPGDGSITIAGSPANPAVAVAANGITNANVANGALSPGKISGTAATLGANTFSGSQAVNGNLSSTGNLALGDSTATTGNVLKGGALFIHNFGVNNTFIGKFAGNLRMTGDNNTATGYLALLGNTTGYQNTAIGSQALLANNTGEANTATGYQALFSNTTGVMNTAMGVLALLNNTTAFNNTAMGYAALYANTTGVDNTALGTSALALNTTGEDNTATGLIALFSNTTGGGNTAQGVFALVNNTTGMSNTATGKGALLNNTTGANNTAIGFDADVASGDLTNATAIGNGAVVDASDKIRLGNAAVTVIEAQTGLTVVSDRNKKENFQALNGEDVLRKIRGLNVMSWNYIGHDPRQFRHYGPVAQEFFAAFGHDGLGTIGTDTTINSSDLEGILTISVQALEKRSQALQAENADLSKKVGAMQAENADLNKEIGSLKARLEAKAENADMNKEIGAMKAENADLNKEISSLKARLEALERLLAKGAVGQ